MTADHSRGTPPEIRRDSRRDGTNNLIHQRIMMLPDLGCDTETGGLYPATDALLSIAVVSRSGSAPFLVYVDPDSQPGKGVCEEAAQKNGFTPERWKKMGAVPIHQALEWLRDWLHAEQSRQPWQGIVCHNLTHDRGFLLEAERMTGIELPGRYDWRCSMSEFQRLMDVGHIPRGSGSLDRLGELSGFWKKEGGRDSKHDALQDARACLHGWEWLIENELAAERRWGELMGQVEALLPALEKTSGGIKASELPEAPDGPEFTPIWRALWLARAATEKESVPGADPCQCVTWARAELAGYSGQHHPRCEHYRPDAPDPRHAVFGRLIWGWIEGQGGDFCWREDSEDILPMAEKAGLCRRVIYDPVLHGEAIEAEPGDEIWFWGKEGEV